MGGDDGRYGWVGSQRAAESPTVIAISLRGLSSIKHGAGIVDDIGARNHPPSGNQKRFSRNPVKRVERFNAFLSRVA
jgi:hypothetical protein